MNTEKRLILAMVISLGIVFAFQTFVDKPKHVPVKISAQAEKPFVAEKTAGTIGKSAVIDETGTFEEKETTIGTKKHEIVFTDLGGAIKTWKLKEYDEGKENVFFEAKKPEDKIFVVESDYIKGLSRAKYAVRENSQEVEYSAEEPGYVRITKKYQFSENSDSIKAAVSIKNLSPGNIELSYRVTGPSAMKEYGNGTSGAFLELNADIDEKLEKKNSVKNVWEKKGQVSWLAQKNLYYTMVMKPLDPAKTVGMSGDRQKGLMSYIATDKMVLLPGEEKTDEYVIYGGPLDEKRLKAAASGMEYVVDYGWFGWISKGLVGILKFFQKGVKNWGVAVILLTILINILTFPLTKKSFISMQRMKQVQPHMEKLKALHKDNPQKLNKEMMELYKKYNVNPFGGCLPMLLQIPIFIGLYQGLIHTLELRGAKFLWMKDLAKPDAFPIPFSLPFLGSTLNLLPILMIVMMFFQQKVTMASSSAGMTPEQMQQQKMMMYMMPIVFGFLFYNMPAGLVLYWLTNTILMTSEQAMLNKTLHAA